MRRRLGGTRVPFAETEERAQFGGGGTTLGESGS